jgi:hypothetical protein
MASPKQLVSDVLLVSDFSLGGQRGADNASMLKASRRLGLRCKCWHWPRISRAGRDVDTKIRELFHDNVAESVVVGDHVRCKLVIAHDPIILKQLPDAPLEVETETCVILITETPNARSNGGRVSYDLPQILENAKTAFGVAPVCAPLSPLVRRFLMEAAQGISLTETDWLPLVDSGQPPRGSSWTSTRTPVVGRYCRDHRENWPSKGRELREAYCADTEIEVRLLGGAKIPGRILGELPSNWTVAGFKSTEVKEFLAGLDFFLHYPHEHALNASIRAPIEAMAAGRPVILPPRFAEIFGDAAAYAEPQDVYRKILELWADKESYKVQADRGLRYVEGNCLSPRFADRVRPYLVQAS